MGNCNILLPLTDRILNIRKDIDSSSIMASEFDLNRQNPAFRITVDRQMDRQIDIEIETEEIAILAYLECFLNDSCCLDL
jgi:hypothetical protein